MLEFKNLRAEDYPIAAPIMARENYGTTESSFVSLYMWGNHYGAQICIKGETVYIRAHFGGKTSYLVPFGGDFRESLLEIYETEKAKGHDVVFFHSVNERMREKLEGEFPGELSYEERRASFDYVYKTEKLASLSGKDFHQKRNHVNKFLKAYEGRFTFREMDVDIIPDVLDFQKKWINMVSDKEGMSSLGYETGAIEEILGKFRFFDLLGGVLFVDGEICAYCIAKKISEDTIDVMVEKADYAYTGAYQAINKFFAASVLGKAEFLNREDDMGISGLRRAKLSYYPEVLVRKYGAIWKR